MAKIPFTLEAWLKDKSQRVETRDGRIVHDIWEVKNAVTAKEYRTEVCALIEGEEDALVFFKNGKYLPVNAESPYDLFIVIPDTELTEFEEHLKQLLDFSVTLSSPYEIDCIKSEAAELLELARKELKKTFVLLHKDDYQTAFDLGKAEALKDLPRWKKCSRPFDSKSNTGINSVNVMVQGYYIPLKDLEKLPGFKED